MKNLLVHWLITAIAVLLTSYLLSGVAVSGFVTALLVALVLGAINTLLRPLLIILTLPINILTLGLLTFFINALLVLLTAAIVPGFHVNGFWWALLFSLVLSTVSSLLHNFTEKIA
jgi:putative membrane protein